MTGRLAFTVVGSPAPQGSKRHVGHGILVESSKAVKPWRQDVRAAAIDARDAAGHDTFAGPVDVTLTFRLPRPAGHWRTGRNAHLLRGAARAWPDTRPDLDKLIRSTLDALGGKGAAVYADDGRVAQVAASKVYVAPGGLCGVDITVEPLPATVADTPPLLHDPALPLAPEASS